MQELETWLNDGQKAGKEFQLTPEAYKPGKLTRFIRHLDELPGSFEDALEGRYIYTDLLLRMGIHDDFTLKGITKMYSLYKRNYAYVASPTVPEERKELYHKLAKGYTFVAKYLEQALDKKWTEACIVKEFLKELGERSNWCTTAWISHLERILAQFDEQKLDRIFLYRNGELEEKEMSLTSRGISTLKGDLDRLFSQARMVVGHQIAYEYADTCYHQASLIRRLLNAKFNFHMPIIETYDSYLDETASIDRDIERKQPTTLRALNYLSNIHLPEKILNRAIRLIGDELRFNRTFNGAFQNWSKAYYEKNPLLSASMSYAEFNDRYIQNGEKKVREKIIVLLIDDAGYADIKIPMELKSQRSLKDSDKEGLHARIPSVKVHQGNAQARKIGFKPSCGEKKKTPSMEM